MDRILTKIFYIVFQVFEVLLIKICKMQSIDFLFLVVFISFYISRHHFSQVFRTLFNIIWKKAFRYKFSFFNGFTQFLLPPSTTTPLTPKIHYAWRTYNNFLRLLCYDGVRKNQNSRAELMFQSDFNPRVVIFT